MSAVSGNLQDSNGGSLTGCRALILECVALLRIWVGLVIALWKLDTSLLKVGHLGSACGLMALAY